VLNKMAIACILLLALWPIQAKQLKDPTRPAVVTTNIDSAQAVVTKPPLVLSSIKVNQLGSIAIINKQAYRVGQRIDQDKIVTISSNQVQFSSGKKLTLFNHSLVSISTKD